MLTTMRKGGKVYTTYCYQTQWARLYSFCGMKMQKMRKVFIFGTETGSFCCYYFHFRLLRCATIFMWSFSVRYHTHTHTQIKTSEKRFQKCNCKTLIHCTKGCRTNTRQLLKYDSCATRILCCQSWNNGRMNGLKRFEKDSGCFILHQHILHHSKYYWCWMIQEGINNFKCRRAKLIADEQKRNERTIKTRRAIVSRCINK